MFAAVWQVTVKQVKLDEIIYVSNDNDHPIPRIGEAIFYNDKTYKVKHVIYMPEDQEVIVSVMS